MKNNALEFIKNANSILLLTHESPDGDAIGSVLAFYNYLKGINKAVDMVIPDIPNVFKFLPSINKAVDRTLNSYDLAIVLDCASKDRICQRDDILSRCKNSICIDHHISNKGYCDINIIEGNISSCCQVVYYLFKDWGLPFSDDILISLMSGVLTDTKGFSINNVDKDTFLMASEFISFGLNIHQLYDRLLCKKTIGQHLLTKLAVDRLEFIEDGKIAFTYIFKQDFIDTNAVIGDHEGIVDVGRNIDGVLVSVFIREDDGFTVSLRSTGIVDVSKIALSLSGGGHFMAAGTKLSLNFKETKELVLNSIKKEINH